MSNLTKRFDPNRDMDDFMRRMSRFFTSPLSFDLGEQPMTTAQWSPAVDISETAEAYVVTAELPDVKKEDIKVAVADGVLTFSGERKQEKEEKNKKYHRIERSYGRFERSFTLPTSVDPTKVAATCRDGTLTIQLPKAPSSTTTREVKIQG